MKPNFLVIGAPKSATTSLCHNAAFRDDFGKSDDFCDFDKYTQRLKQAG